MVYRDFAAIDPLALILREDIYVRLTLPDPPPPDVAVIRATLASLSAEDRKFVATRNRAMGLYVKAVEKALGAAEAGA